MLWRLNFAVALVESKEISSVTLSMENDRYGWRVDGRKLLATAFIEL